MRRGVWLERFWGLRTCGSRPAARVTLLLAVVTCALAVPGTALAADFTWSGAAADSAWSNPSNWVGNSAPSGSVGILAFPALTSAPCTASPPTGTCFTSDNDLVGVSATGLSIDDGSQYNITGNAITLNGGGLTASTKAAAFGSASLRLPITLSASQTWSIDGNNNDSQIVLSGDVSGSGSSLGVTLSHQTFLGLNGNDVEVGPVTIAGGDTSATGNGALVNGAVAIGNPLAGAKLNATDGNPISLHAAGIFANGATIGALSSTGGNLQIGEEGGTPTGTLMVNGALTLDAASSVSMFVNHSGTVAGTDYSQIAATGSVNLAGAHLDLSGRDGTGACPSLNPGDTDTLITTSGVLTGTFAGIPDGGTMSLVCPTAPAPTFRINYTTQTVTATVLANTGPPVNTSPPTISGNVTQGQTLTAAHGTWSNGPTSFAEQWLDCDSAGNNCTPIAGATGQTYTLTGSDVGHTVRVQETASNGSGPGSPANSAPSGAIQAAPPTATAPSNQSAPVITGVATSGETLSASAGTWSGTAPISYTYQWQRCAPACADIASAPAPSYTLTTADAGALVRVVVTATNGTGAASASSNEVGPVESAAPPPPAPPVRGKTTTVAPEKGFVLIKLPAGANPRAFRLSEAAANGFVPLTAATTVPVGSILDTSRGQVQLSTATNASGSTQTGHFSRGLFQVQQSRKNPLTTLSMTGGGLNGCHTKLPSGGAARVTAARKRRRSLFSDVHGHFRTRGRNSTATVRGTQWTMTDTCAGTLTTVQRGAVMVRDLRLRKTKLVKAGHKYLARAPKPRKK